MVGFPTETEEEYNDTLTAMDYLSPLEAFMYYYNLREGTPAAKMEGQIDEEVKTARLERLIDEQLRRCAEMKQKRIGLVSQALVLGPTRNDKEAFLARNEHNEMMSFHPSSASVRPGDIVNLKTTELKGNTYLAVEA